MENKYNQKYENQIVLLAQNKVESGHYKIFDNDARVITKRNFPEVVESGKSDYESCLIVCNREGETIIITQEFSQILFNALQAGN
jgi:hypothetical protein